MKDKKQYTVGLINQVNRLIDEVEYVVETATTDATYLNSKLLNLANWAGEICAYIQHENQPALIANIKASGPLYALMLKAKMPTETRESISDYCAMIADLRKWAKPMPITNTPQEPTTRRKPGRPRQQYRPFADYIETNDPEKRAKIIDAIASLMGTTDKIRRKIWVLRAALELGIFGDRPDKKSVESAFDLSMARSTYNYGYDESKRPEPTIYANFINRLRAAIAEPN